MTLRETAAEIEEAAAHWAARIDRRLTAAEEAALAAWLAGDIRREGALVRAEAAWLHAERAASLGVMPSAEAERPAVEAPLAVLAHHRAARPLWTRRAALVGGGAIAASLAGAMLLPRAAASSEQIFTTGAGQIGQLALADGTALVLDTATRVATSMNHGGHSLRLIEGRVLLDLARQDGRPVTVTARGIPMRGTGLFAIAALASQPLGVMVERGRVLVGSSVRSIRLDAGMSLSLPEGARLAAATIRHLSAAAMREAMQWRSGMLAFTGMTLGQAVAQMNRYGGVPIVVRDASLAMAPIAGVFRNNDPAGFAAAIADSLEARTFRDAGRIVIAK